jgi:hypothetical protein
MTRNTRGPTPDQTETMLTATNWQPSRKLAIPVSNR